MKKRGKTQGGSIWAHGCRACPNLQASLRPLVSRVSLLHSCRASGYIYIAAKVVKRLVLSIGEELGLGRIECPH